MPTRARNEVGFVSHFVAPLWQLLSTRIPELAPCHAALQDNLSRWKAIASGSDDEGRQPQPRTYTAGEDAAHSLAVIQADLESLPLLPSEVAGTTQRLSLVY